MSKADLILTVTDRYNSEAFSAWFRAQGIPLVLTLLGRGTATTEILDYLGLESTEKSVLLCVAGHSPRLIRRAARELWLDVLGRGILMTVPLGSVGGKATMDYLLQHQEVEDAMEMEKKLTHQLIVVITNQGHTDEVMEAARAAGATGGTAVHAKGTGTELAKKFFGVSIAEEKELILILAREETRAAIMQAVIRKAGMQTEAQSMVFSLPVSDLAGLRQLED